MTGTLDLVGEGTRRFSPEEGAVLLEQRLSRTDLAPHASLPDDTRLWAALQNISGGTWGGCVYDLDAVLQRLAGSNGAV
jgi:hypothetical protein